MYYHDHMNAGGWIFMAVFSVLLIGLLVALVVWLVQDQRHRLHRYHHLAGASAAEILDRRLATGEINVQEYERLKASLATPGSIPSPSTAQPAAPET